MTIRVILADDHVLMRAALGLLLAGAPDMEVVAEVGSGQAVLDCVLQVRADVVCMDLSMPGLGGVQTTRELLREYPLVRVIGLSAHVDLHRVAEICAAGAIGYVVKHSAGADLVAAIRQASQNRTYFSRALGITGLDELAAYQQR